MRSSTPHFMKLTLSDSPSVCRALSGTLLVGCLFALSGCDSGQSDALDTASTSTSPSPRVSAQAPVDRAKDSAPTRPFLSSALTSGEGSSAIEGLGGDGDADANAVTLQLRYTPRGQILGQLASRYAFKVIGRADGETRIDIDVEDVSLEAALAAVLEGQAYALQYAASSTEGRKVEAILIGGIDQHLDTLRNQRMAKRRSERNKKNAQERKQERSARHDKLAALAPSERTEYLERERAEREANSRAAAERAREQLYSRDPEERVAALERLGADSINLEELAEIAQRDPDPRVRAAAVSNASDTESPAGRDIVHAATEDADSSVVLEAIESMMFDDSKSSLPVLNDLLGHNDPKVAAAAAESIDFIQD
ncbi:MAG: HEAT repeat domain-containing protein [Myxococcota bacterium]